MFESRGFVSDVAVPHQGAFDADIIQHFQRVSKLKNYLCDKSIKYC